MAQLKLEKHSQIASIISNIRNYRVPTSAFHRRQCMEELAPFGDKKTWYMTLDDAKQNKDNMLIGGYGFGNEDTGADCPITQGVYSLHMFATKCDADIGHYFNLGKMHLTRKSNEIERLTGYILNGSLDAQLDHPHPHDTVEFVAAPIITSKNVQMYAMGLIANVERRGLKYRGDITFRLDSELGKGQTYLNRERSGLSQDSHGAKIFNDMLKTESLKTKDVVFSRSLIGASFRRAILDQIESMKDVARQSGIDYDCTNFMLRVENLFPADRYARN